MYILPTASLHEAWIRYNEKRKNYMLAYFMIVNSFPVIAVSMLIMVYPFLLGLFMTSWVVVLFGILNNAYRTVVGFIEYIVPVSWRFGDITQSDSGYQFNDPTFFERWIWGPFSSFQLPTHNDVAVIGWFIAIVWVLELYFLFKLLKRRVEGGRRVPEVADDISILGVTRKDRENY